jgi:DNA-binding transcriptional MerR regulator
MKPEIPDKLYFKIGEVSKLVGVAQHVLRYWESEFPSIHPQRAGSQQRLYRRVDVEMVWNIKNLLHQQGYTIAGAKKILEREQKNKVTKHPVQLKDAMAVHWSQIKSELREIEELVAKKNTEKESEQNQE